MSALDGVAIQQSGTTENLDLDTEFAEFYAAQRDSVFRAVLVATRNPHRAEDAVQEAFVRAYDRWSIVRTLDRPLAWVVRIALNAATSWWRRHRRELGAPPDGPAPPDSRPVDADLVRMVWSLPPRQREVLALRVLADLSTAETALTLGIAEGTVKATLHRALRRLRDGLEAKETR